MGKLEKYSSYKDSGVDWLGEIPEHWEVKKIKHLVDEILGGGTPESSNSKYWTNILEEAYLWVSIADMTKSEFIQDTKKYITTNGLKNCSAWLIPPYSILYSIYASLGKVAFSDKVLTTNQAILSMIFKENYYYKFMFYYLQTLTQVAIQLSNSTTQDNISLDVLKNLICSIPPKQEQTKIASFLDEKIAQIDEVISQKQKLIELLKERKQIVINDAVTEGLDKNVEFVDSGVEWMGEIPKHWKLIPLKYILKERNERSVSGEETLFMMSQIHGLVVRADYHEKAEIAKDNIGNKKVYKNDLVFNKLKAHLGVFYKSNINETGLVSPDYAVYYSNDKIEDLKFLEILFRHPKYIGQFISLATGIVEGLIRLYTDDLFSLKVAVPPKEEQKQIIIHCEEQISEIDKAIELQQNYISKLKEYKASLIDSVVTGKVRV